MSIAQEPVRYRFDTEGTAIEVAAQAVGTNTGLPEIFTWEIKYLVIKNLWNNYTTCHDVLAESRIIEADSLDCCDTDLPMDYLNGNNTGLWP